MKQPIDTLEATIKGKPIVWARAADRRLGGRYTPGPYRSWKTLASQVIALMGRYRRLEGEISVTIDLYADRVEVKATTLEPGDNRRQPTGLTGDIDNYAKAVLDAMQTAGVIADDIAVAELHIRFRPSEETPNATR